MVLGAAVAQRPGIGGHTWMALQWLLGFRSLGWEPILVDWVDSSMCRDASGRQCPPEDSAGVAYLARSMEQAGLGDAWAVLIPGGESLGLGRAELERRVSSSELLLNVMGYLEDELLRPVPLRVFLDIDPGFGQMWKALELHDVFSGHDRVVSLGANVGGSGCGVPAVGLDWEHTLPPVALDQWPAAPGGEAVTSVATWRGPFGPVEYDGRTFGLRVHEFRRFLDLPARTGATFRLALDIDPADGGDRARLTAAGWQLLDPRSVAGDPLAYREFIQTSAAELNIGKNMYVETRGGWFSDRSACYLASGKPVLAQDTGFGDVLPTGEGLLTFVSLDDAAAATEAVLADRSRQSRAARRLAEEHFAADRVVARLLDRLGVT
jgi:hypothetical protein